MKEKIYAMTLDNFKKFNILGAKLKLDIIRDVYPKTQFRGLLQSVNRNEVEDNPNFKQIIPYIVIMDHYNNILTYTRKGSEQRLFEKQSIGFGGHWKNNEDFFECIQRELSEELSIKEFYDILFTFIDTIYSEETFVSSVHYGFLILATIKDFSNIKGYENNEIKDIRICHFTEIEPDRLETWSRIAYEKLNICNINKIVRETKKVNNLL
jgi:predicted NUDIX family phosphoesterase